MTLPKKTTIGIFIVVFLFGIIGSLIISTQTNIKSDNTYNQVTNKIKGKNKTDYSNEEILSIYNSAITKAMSVEDKTFNITHLKAFSVNGHILFDENKSQNYNNSNIQSTIKRFSSFKKEMFPSASLVKDDVLSCEACENDNTVEMIFTVKGCKLFYDDYPHDTSIGKLRCGLGNVKQLFEFWGYYCIDGFNDSYLEYQPVSVCCSINKDTGDIIKCDWKYSIVIKLDNLKAVYKENDINNNEIIELNDSILWLDVKFEYAQQ